MDSPQTSHPTLSPKTKKIKIKIKPSFQLFTEHIKTYNTTCHQKASKSYKSDIIQLSILYHMKEN